MTMMEPTAAHWLDLFVHFASLSLLGVGGTITTAPDMHRFLVNQNGWLSDTQFTSSIALSQAAPGPNVLFVALMGWSVGLNAGGGAAAGTLALLGAMVSMAGILIPSSVLTYTATSWLHRNRELRSVRAFKAGMAPIVIGLLVSTGWLLTGSHDNPARDWPLWLLTVCAALLVWRTKIHLLWILGAGALLGAIGLV